MTAILFAAVLASTNPTPEQLLVWRKPDSEGRSCASCHSPDGIELSKYKFGSADIARRASRHLQPNDQATIVAMLALTNSSTPDPLNDRPGQPGGRVLPGATPSVRDLAFGNELKTALPYLMGKAIVNIAQATKARDEILNLDLRKLRIGIEFNRISEDVFHGSEHATIASWFPDVPIHLSPDIVARQDQYLAKPTVSNLREIDSAVLAANPPTSALDSIALAKYRSLLVFSHRLRVGTKEPIVLGKGFQANPMWMVAEAARFYSGSNASALSIPAGVASEKKRPWAEQLKEMRLPWFWLGWMEDPALFQSGQLSETRTGHYFVTALLDDGPYPIHAAFVAAKRMVDLGYKPGSWKSTIARHLEIQYSALAVSDRFKDAEPTQPAQRELYKTLLGNLHRMSSLLLLEDLTRTGRAIRPESQLGQLTQVQQYVPMDAKIFTSLTKRLKNAKPELPKEQ
ncbi:hypothetical protein BH11ARM1_BH11ARM1_04680 [soil metagenome]